jgi:choline-phosphate cytidylyltransferase
MDLKSQKLFGNYCRLLLESNITYIILEIITIFYLMAKNDFPDGLDPSNPVRIFTDGVFDCFHYGHAKVLEQCKKMFKHVYLIVGVCSDEDTRKEKAKTVMTFKERYEAVIHCKWADEVVQCPWACTLEFLDSIGAHYIARDPEPYPCEDLSDIYGVFKINRRFLATHRTEGVSTTDLILRILNDYNLYLERQVRKGCTAKDLGISNTKFLAVKLASIFRQKKEKTLKLLGD